jgi:dinuclear metal center YbgI/SA1388 family protein
MTRRVSDLIRALDARAPRGTAESWDNVGLLVGSGEWKTAGVVVSIDLTSEAIQTARKYGYRLIINHHPCIFPKSQGLSQVTPEAGTPELIFEAIRQGIAVAVFHTNFDRCALEVVERVAKGLKATPLGRLTDNSNELLTKLVVFVPQSHVEDIRRAICDAGAGHIGNYDFCTFGVMGRGSFRGSESTRPFLGRPGNLEIIDEVRLETVFPRGLQGPVLQALFKAHPYEEIAYDLYPVEQSPSSAGLMRGMGYGFWGDFPKPRSFSELVRDVNRLFKVNGFWMTGQISLSKEIRRVAFVAGKGAGFIDAALVAGCDLFITGEAGYHAALGAVRKGMVVLELGHRESERFFLSTLKAWLKHEEIESVELDQPTQKFFLGEKK